MVEVEEAEEVPMDSQSMSKELKLEAMSQLALAYLRKSQVATSQASIQRCSAEFLTHRVSHPLHEAYSLRLEKRSSGIEQCLR